MRLGLNLKHHEKYILLCSLEMQTDVGQWRNYRVFDGRGRSNEMRSYPQFFCGESARDPKVKCYAWNILKPKQAGKFTILTFVLRSHKNWLRQFLCLVAYYARRQLPLCPFHQLCYCMHRPVESQIGARGMTLTGPPAGCLTHE